MYMVMVRWGTSWGYFSSRVACTYEMLGLLEVY